MRALMLRAAVASEVGPGENDEDAAFASSRLAAVADGVGGAAAGEVASRLAIDKLIGLERRLGRERVRDRQRRDSRTYMYRSGRLRRLTRDQSLSRC